MIRMKHPQHGFCHAYDLAEEKRLRSIGWIGEDEDPETTIADAIDKDAAQDQQPKRRGRPPKVVTDGA